MGNSGHIVFDISTQSLLGPIEVPAVDFQMIFSVANAMALFSGSDWRQCSNFPIDTCLVLHEHFLPLLPLVYG